MSICSEWHNRLCGSVEGVKEVGTWRPHLSVTTVLWPPQPEGSLPCGSTRPVLQAAHSECGCHIMLDATQACFRSPHSPPAAHPRWLRTTHASRYSACLHSPLPMEMTLSALMHFCTQMTSSITLSSSLHTSLSTSTSRQACAHTHAHTRTHAQEQGDKGHMPVLWVLLAHVSGAQRWFVRQPSKPCLCCRHCVPHVLCWCG